jgi:hypothetical protein
VTVETLKPGTWVCALHSYHGTAVPIRGVVHHVLPRGAGGPDTAENRVTICANGHDAVHAVMWELVNGRMPPKCSRTELRMARVGLSKWHLAGEPGSIRAFMG